METNQRQKYSSEALMHCALNCVLIIVQEDLAVWLFFSHFVIHLILITEWTYFLSTPLLKARA
jgi:hypothetical protein